MQKEENLAIHPGLGGGAGLTGTAAGGAGALERQEGLGHGKSSSEEDLGSERGLAAEKCSEAPKGGSFQLTPHPQGIFQSPVQTSANRRASLEMRLPEPSPHYKAFLSTSSHR